MRFFFLVIVAFLSLFSFLGFQEIYAQNDWLDNYASSQSDPKALSNCTIGNYFGSFGLGSWVLKVVGEDSGICNMGYVWEIEGGYTEYECRIQTDKIKTTDWNSKAVPFEESLVDNFCVIVKEGNFFFDIRENRKVTYSPLKQIANGVSPKEVICREKLQLIFKMDNSPVCVKPESIPKLIERGWAKSFVQISKNVKIDAGFPFKFLDFPPKGFEVVCSEIIYGHGVDVWYNRVEMDCKQVNPDKTISNGGIAIGFRPSFDPNDPDELTGLELVELRLEKVGDRGQIVDINGNAGLVISNCIGCGSINYNLTNGTTVSSTNSFSTPNKIQFYDENGTFYNIRSNQSTEMLLEVARSLR